MIERALRWAAIAIAVGAVVDPPVRWPSSSRPRVGVLEQRSWSMSLPASDGSPRRDAARRVRLRLEHDLADTIELVDGFDPSTIATIVIGDRYPEQPLPEQARVSTVDVGGALSPNVRIVSVDVPRVVPLATAVPIRVEVAGDGVRGHDTAVTIKAGGAEVAQASHRWTTDSERWEASFDAVPAGEPPFAFEVVADTLPSERTAVDNRVALHVDAGPKLRVLVWEGRPSWASAFVRRALESDPRFDVSGVLQTAPSMPVRTGESPRLAADDLDRFDVVIAGGLERLSPSEMNLLARFARERGGSVLLLPDALDGANRERTLVADVRVRESLLERPLDVAAVPPLPAVRATELAISSNLPSDASVLARGAQATDALVWSAPLGAGQVIVSGLLDAWRYRGDQADTFDRFWRSVVSGLALSAVPPIAVDVTPASSASGRVRVSARLRSDVAGRDTATRVEARVGTRVVRLWPGAERGEYDGVASGIESPAAVTVSAGALGATRGRATFDDDRFELAGPELALLARARGGVAVTPATLATLEGHLHSTIRLERTTSVRHPFRSPWWILPFAACVFAEWWLRRRRGAR